MEPFGPENLRPVFMTKKVKDTGYSKIVKEDHIRFSLTQNNIVFTGIGFNMAEKFYLLQQKKPVDIVFKIDENEWNGNKSLQLRMLDFKVCQ
jgi:single-stranded-DNA-specific exonuclease